MWNILRGLLLHWRIGEGGGYLGRVPPPLTKVLNFMCFCCFFSNVCKVQDWNLEDATALLKKLQVPRSKCNYFHFFRYSTQNLFFSDRGFKEIMRTRLRIMHTQTYSYNVTINPVYSGISKEVNGIAVDWLSGSLYWTDALYNWISVCDSQRFDIYRHLVTTGLDKPIGIAVDPAAG